MTQVEKIKAEVESLYAKTSIGLNEYTAGYENGKAEVCGLLLNLINSMQKELECEDLELASERYACKFSSSKYGHDKVKDAVIWGANWQKEQMLKDAVEGSVSYRVGEYGEVRTTINYKLPKEYNCGDKVKLIIVKED